MKNLLISLLIGGAVIGGSIAAVRYYNKSQQQKLAEGVLTAVQKGDINAMYDACQKLIDQMTPRAGNYTGIWIGCEGNPAQPVCHDVANGNGCNPATRPFCEGSSSISIPPITVPTVPSVIPPEFTPVNPTDIR